MAGCIRLMPIVSRIAFLCSEILLDSRDKNDGLLDELQTGKQLEDSGLRLITVTSGELGSYTKRFSNPDKLLSVVVITSPGTVVHLLSVLTGLSNAPVVIHVEVDGDLSDVLLLRSAVPYILYSANYQQAHDNALTASKLALLVRKPVVHIIESEGVREERAADDGISDAAIREFMMSAVIPSPETELCGHVGNGDVAADGDGEVENIINGPAGISFEELRTVTETSLSCSDAEATRFYRLYNSVRIPTATLTKRSPCPFSCRGTSSEAHTVVFLAGLCPITDADGVKWVSMSMLAPLPSYTILRYVRPCVKRILVLEQAGGWSLKWTPLYLDVMAAVQSIKSVDVPSVQSVILGHHSTLPPDVYRSLKRCINPDHSQIQVHLGTSKASTKLVVEVGSVVIPKHESSYTKMLSHLFSDRLEISNSSEQARGSAATNPEFALGTIRRKLEERAKFIHFVQNLILQEEISEQMHSLLTNWLLVRNDVAQCVKMLKTVQEISKTSEYQSIPSLSSFGSHICPKSFWILGSDAWSYDLGLAGIHQLIVSGLNVNILIIESMSYTRSKSNDETNRRRRKRDIGLYAMSHGDVYVASVAVFSSYTHVLQALTEADRFKGPSVVLAYLPYTSEETPALEVLKETKLAVDSGYWPLYRWDPSKESEGKEPFSLDSDVIKQELRDFLDRQNHLSQLSRSKPELAAELVNSLGGKMQDARRQRAKEEYKALVSSISAVPLLILYASDGGGAEKKAKRLATRGKARGLATNVMTMDSVTLEEVAEQEYVVFITSVSGQGEAPQNGRKFAKSLTALIARGEKPFLNLKYAVFGMGDSHYWPRPEDAHYYNKASKDLDNRLQQVGGERFIELRFGDDQDEDGPETGYKLWEPLVWKQFGVDNVKVGDAEPEPVTIEHMKIASKYLRGTISEWLADKNTIPMSSSDVHVAKFHGIYQQDDRDIRDELSEPAYAFMIRVRLPAGVCTPSQWLVLDRIADAYGNGTFKLTTRQTFQFHGIIKKHLKTTIQEINKSLLDTLVACGDAIRNILCSTIPTKSHLHSQVYDFACAVSERHLPNSTAYHEIWLDKKLVVGGAVQDFEPFYGKDYLPRKFKIAIAVPPTNDVDVFTHDLGLVAIVDNSGNLAGFNVFVGGGMGVTHGNKKTYPRLGSNLGFCTVDQGHAVVENLMLFQRDNGNRADRKTARLMYTIDRIGFEAFRAKISKMLGWPFQPARPFEFDRNTDDYGWSQNENGNHNFLMFIENGRVQDVPGVEFKTALREIATVHKGSFRLTANQHLMLADIPSKDLGLIKSLLAKYKLDNLNHSGLRLSSSACVAFPTCGLAMAESERYLPLLINKVESICEENGLRNDSIVMRMSGCPNGCSRPYLGEIGFVGKAPGTYLMLLGGGHHGQRLNKLFRDSVTEPEILSILKPMIKHYALERQEGEHFGDFTIRAGYTLPTLDGKDWYNGTGGLGKYRQ